MIIGLDWVLICMLIAFGCGLVAGIRLRQL